MPDAPADPVAPPSVDPRPTGLWGVTDDTTAPRSSARPPRRSSPEAAKPVPKRAEVPTPSRRSSRRAAKGKLPRAQRPPRWRGRVLPKSILGISLLMLSFGVGMAASGVGLYLYYQYRVDTSEALIKNFRVQFSRAKETIRNESTNAKAQISAELEPLRKIAATSQTLEALLAQDQASLWSVSTFDSAGAAVVGTSFVVASDAQKSFLLTSFAVAKAATVKPGPDIMVRKGADERKATLWTWDESKDLALLIIDKGGLTRLDWAPLKDLRLGDRVFALSGLGTAGGAITQGYIADVSTTGIQHDAAIGTAFQGGPVVDSNGKVVSVGSRHYAPLGFASDGVYFGVPVNAACDKVLSCPGGRVAGAGQQAGH